MTKEERIQWIDNATYEQLLSKWRFEPSGSLWFQGDVGKYFQKVIREKREEVGNEEHVRVSKSIGW